MESILAGLPEPFGGSVLGLASGVGVFGDVWEPSIPGLPASLGGRGGRGERDDTDSKAGNTAPKVGRVRTGGLSMRRQAIRRQRWAGYRKAGMVLKEGTGLEGG